MTIALTKTATGRLEPQGNARVRSLGGGGPRSNFVISADRCQPHQHPVSYFINPLKASASVSVVHACNQSMDSQTMNIPEPGKGEPMEDQAVMRGVLSRNAPKRLARLMSVSVETARCWLYRHLSASRRREIALALIAEMDREDRRRAAYRQHLVDMARADDQVAGRAAGDAVQEAGRDGNSAPTSRVGE